MTNIPLPKRKKRGLLKKRVPSTKQVLKQRKTKVTKQLESLENKARRRRKEKEKLDKTLSVLGGETIIEDDVLGEAALSVQKRLKENIIFEPNPGPQTDFLAASEREIFYGGSRGSGKSFAMIVDPLRYCHKGAARALILRRTMPELRDLIEHTRQLYPKVFPRVKWREQEKEWRFPSGARIEFGYAETRKDALRYQGQAYTWIGVDELPQFPNIDIWNDLRGSLRSVDPEVPIFMRACVDQGDVLTENGWKDIYQIKKGELVYSFNIDTKQLELKSVTNTYIYNINEDLVRIRGKGKYFSFTKDHKVVWKNCSNGKYKSTRFNEIKNKNIYLCRSGKFSGLGYSGETLGLTANQFMWFLGLFLSEGHTTTRNRTGITQVKEKETKIVKAFLYGLRSDWKYYKNGDFTIHDKKWHEYLSQFGKSKDKFIPREILQTATQDELRLLFDALMFGDGNWQSETSGTYYTISKQLVDDISELGIKLGYKVWAKIRKNTGFPSKNLQYEIYFQNRNDCSTITKDHISYEHYKGTVACISVQDNETFILRQKETPGSPYSLWITNNTGNP